MYIYIYIRNSPMISNIFGWILPSTASMLSKYPQKIHIINFTPLDPNHDELTGPFDSSSSPKRCRLGAKPPFFRLEDPRISTETRDSPWRVSNRDPPWPWSQGIYLRDGRCIKINKDAATMQTRSSFWRDVSDEFFWDGSWESVWRMWR